MIQANELRIGNLIKLSPLYDSLNTHSDYSIVNGIDKSYCFLRTNMTVKWKFVEPIPLTEERMLKFGFEKTVSIIGKSETEYIDYRMKYFVCFLLPDGKGLEVEFWAKHNTINERGYITNIQYVHQLQNLYFALTGTELTII